MRDQDAVSIICRNLLPALSVLPDQYANRGLRMKVGTSDKRKGKLIVDTFAKFGIGTELMRITHGATYTLFELGLDEGTKVAAVWRLADNLAMVLSVTCVRIIAPIPGKTAIGIEVPNKKREWVEFDSLTGALDAERELRIPVALGKNVRDETVVIDLASCPHLLVGGNTETGKTTFLDMLICSIMRTRAEEDVLLAIVDTKGVEFPVYNGNPHLMLPVITNTEDAFVFLDNLVKEIDRRVSLFNETGVRKIEEYNRRIHEKQDSLQKKLPYIVVLVDEFSYLMLEDGKRFEALIKRITAVARFCGIHLVISTNRCSADVISGVIKSNFPSQIAFAVTSGINSRIILDQLGAEKLLGPGDMLFSMGGWRNPIRVQGAFVDSLNEISKLSNR